ncbi:MAG: hypothetical protein H6978_12580 [Gammaproteobacteria bacterium]|nr:hypothetical protein [Gammaproteobacteria bacterium]
MTSVWLFASGTVAAQGTDCSVIDDSAERLACYDARNNIGSELPVGASPSSVRAQSQLPLIARQQGATPASDFGTRQARLEAAPEELVSQVAELKRYDGHRLYVILANGQTWKQVVDRRYDIREGDTVRIYPSRWGNNFRLSTERLNGFIQVERLE